MINLVFCLYLRSQDSPYLIGLAATYASIRANTRARLRVNILHDDTLLDGPKEMLKQSLGGEDEIVFCHASVVPEAYELSKKLDGRYSPAIIWRAWLAEYFPDLRRCLLLDCDLLFLCDVLALWNVRLGSNALSAPFGGGWRLNEVYFNWIGSSKEKYFRVCVVLMNLKKIRKMYAFQHGRVSFLADAYSRMGTGPGSYLLEQSLFNKFFSGSSKPLPLEVFAANGVEKNVERHAILGLKVLKKEPLIIDIKGWENSSEFTLLYWSFVLRTAWRDVAQEQWLELRPPMPPRSEP